MKRIKSLPAWQLCVNEERQPTSFKTAYKIEIIDHCMWSARIKKKVIDVRMCVCRGMRMEVRGGGREAKERDRARDRQKGWLSVECRREAS